MLGFCSVVGNAKGDGDLERERPDGVTRPPGPLDWMVLSKDCSSLHRD